jgi:CAAX protease family protein
MVPDRLIRNVRPAAAVGHGSDKGVLMKLFLQLLTVAVVAFVGGQVTAAVEGEPWLMLAAGVVTAVLAILVYAGMVRLTEKRRPVMEVAGRSAAGGLGLGTLIGVAIFGAVILNIGFLGYYRVHGAAWTTDVVGLVGYMGAAAVTEELLFRGVLFRIAEKRLGTWWAMLLSSVVFGAFHMLNPDASVWGAVCIVLEAGGMLTAAYVATRKLWVPIGLHFGWNFAESALFSTEVSGNGANKGLLDATMSGPTIATGGHFGPEGSLYSVVFCVLAAVVFLLVARRRGNLVPRRRTDARPTATATLAP